MPYLPTSNILETNFPIQFGKDLNHQILLIEEHYQRFFPLITYYPLAYSPEPRGGTGTEDPTDFDTLIGTTAETMIDPLYNEPVPEGSGTWTAHDATTPQGEADRYVYGDTVAMNMRIRRDSKDETRKPTGDSETRVLTGYVPLSILDTLSITVQNGDKLIWDGDWMRVKESGREGYWKNTNVRLYLRLDLETISEGS